MDKRETQDRLLRSLMDDFVEGDMPAELFRKEETGGATDILRVAIDDFGSNGHVVILPFELPVDTAKFDLSYLRNAAKSDAGRIMLTGLVESFQKAGLRLISEGVETEEDLALVTSLGIRSIQGFFYDRPLGIAAFERKYLS